MAQNDVPLFGASLMLAIVILNEVKDLPHKHQASNPLVIFKHT